MFDIFFPKMENLPSGDPFQHPQIPQKAFSAGGLRPPWAPWGPIAVPRPLAEIFRDLRRTNLRLAATPQERNYRLQNYSWATELSNLCMKKAVELDKKSKKLLFEKEAQGQTIKQTLIDCYIHTTKITGLLSGTRIPEDSLFELSCVFLVYS